MKVPVKRWAPALAIAAVVISAAYVATWWHNDGHMGAVSSSVAPVSVATRRPSLPKLDKSVSTRPAKPLLWKIEGPGVETPSYLFGTIHLGKALVGDLHPAAEMAFRESAAVHTEIAMDEKWEDVKQLFTRDDGKTLEESIGADLTRRLAAALTLVDCPAKVEALSHKKTWYAAYVVGSFRSRQADAGTALDMRLWDRAVKEGKRTAGMQTQEAQLLGFLELTEEEQIAFLSETIRYFIEEDEDFDESLKESIDAYLSGEPERLVALIESEERTTLGGRHGELGKRIMKRILDDRNVIMADYIDRVLKEDGREVNFFAAGAAHFVFDNGVRSYLEKKGYKVTRISE